MLSACRQQFAAASAFRKLLRFRFPPARIAETAHLGFLFVLIVGLIAGTISGIVGTGSSIMLMPVLIYEFGPKQAVPIMAIAAVMSNFSRILAWWREVDWRACAVGAALTCRGYRDRPVSEG